MKTDAFGKKIPEIKEVFQDRKVEKYIEQRLGKVLDYLEVGNAEGVVDEVVHAARTYKSIPEYEYTIHKLFDQKRIIQRIPIKLSSRAQLMFNQIRESLKGHHVLDLGCGDGKVGELIEKQGRQVVLADVYENGNISNLNLPFVLIKQKNKLPFDDDLFDTTLLLTVLHHSDNPKKVISETRRVTKAGGRIIVIESVYGVPGYSKNLNEEEQRLANVFFDHFYNRIIHYSEFEENKVNVPFNFQTPNAWKQFFEENGLKQVKVVSLGFDQPTVPEYHTMHVLEVLK